MFYVLYITVDFQSIQHTFKSGTLQMTLLFIGNHLIFYLLECRECPTFLQHVLEIKAITDINDIHSKKRHVEPSR